MSLGGRHRDASAIPQLALGGSGLRFEQPSTEQEYRAWFRHEALPFSRLGLAASAMAWLTIFGAFSFLPEGSTRTAGWVFGVVMPALLVAYLSTLGSRWPRMAMELTAITNLVAGIALIHLCGDLYQEPIGVATATCGMIFFAFTVYRLHPTRAVLAVLPYSAYAVVVELREYHRLEISHTGLVIGLGAPLTCLVCGITASIATERVLRTSYRQSRIIEIQDQMLEQERTRSDALLANMLPEPIVARLKDSPGSIADGHEQVTVLFADVVGFTPLSARLPPSEVVEFLNQVFTRFDELARHHKVEKIKTIGDAYMAVAGIPVERADHAHAIAALALDMAATVEDLRQATGHPLEFRIGIESGPAVAGVIGTSKFAYDLWGDTVNTAARLESHGVPSRIQVGRTAYEHLRDHFVLSSRGLVDLKGKGPTMAYFLEAQACRCASATLNPDVPGAETDAPPDQSVIQSGLRSRRRRASRELLDALPNAHGKER